MAKTKRGLNKGMRKFCEQWVLNQNGAEAYAKAYPSSRKHTPAYRANKANKLTKRADIQAYIQHIMPIKQAVADEKFAITAERVLSEMAAIAFANSKDYFEWGFNEVPRFNRKTGEPVLGKDGQPIIDRIPFAIAKPSHELTREQTSAIVGAEMSFSKSGEPMVSVKMADKRAALKDLMAHLGLLKMDLNAKVTGAGGGPIQLVISSAEDAL